MGTLSSSTRVLRIALSLVSGKLMVQTNPLASSGGGGASEMNWGVCRTLHRCS